MANFSPLTLAFLEQKPIPAARELAALPAVEAAQFLDNIPARFAAPVLAAMAPWSASLILCEMTSAAVAAVLGIIDYREASAMLRHTKAADRPAVFKDLPKNLRQDFETSLKFPDNTVGAHMSDAILSLSEDHTIADAIALFRQAGKTRSKLIQIIGKDHKLIGAVSAQDLLLSPKSATLGDIADRKVTGISARATLASLRDLSIWDTHAELPVINRQGQAIGVLHRQTLTTNLLRPSLATQSSDRSITVTILDAFYASVVGLTALLTGEQTPPTAPEEKQQ